VRKRVRWQISSERLKSNPCRFEADRDEQEGRQTASGGCGVLGGSPKTRHTIEAYGAKTLKTILWAADDQPLVSNDTPSK
jgi:hypothetical protein